ncbi:proline-rich domain-containing protein [Halorussus caseinilyticus]|uniref:Proline-rich domain-containing protein n=1 Tax=Halorussus caseinilyticus TaxID=3034025 RepID=A0ABD5WKS2_9EURY
MNARSQQILAVAFSILIVTATVTPATAALDSPPSQSDADLPSLSSLATTIAGHELFPDTPGNGNGNGPGNGKGNGPSKTTTTTATTTTAGNETTTPGQSPPENPGQGPPKNKTQGPPENPGQGPPENKTQGPPENPGQGPPENPGQGPPPHAGPPSWVPNKGGNSNTDKRGPPEWAKNGQAPPPVSNRSALANRSEPLANATFNVSIRENASAADYRLAAIDALQTTEFDAPGSSADDHRRQALRELNESLDYVLDANRTTSAELFERDKEASTPPQFAPSVTKLLVRSDERLAHTAIADADRLATTLNDRNVSFDQQAVAENISGARRAVERAERFRARGQQHTAISQYRVAWIHAQQALDVLDLAATPNVTITTREDMPHEENVTYAVRGRVFDVRGHELALSLSLNGANRTLDLAVNTTPGAVGTFETNVTLSRQVNRITVSATDPNRRWSPDYGGENATVGRDVLRLDGDGLPDFYELNVTGTDPLGPDSNASRTSFNESGNNITDGAEDFDNDGRPPRKPTGSTSTRWTTTPTATAYRTASNSSSKRSTRWTPTPTTTRFGTPPRTSTTTRCRTAASRQQVRIRSKTTPTATR